MEPFFSLISEEDITYWKQKVLIFTFIKIPNYYCYCFFFFFDCLCWIVVSIMLFTLSQGTSMCKKRVQFSSTSDLFDGIRNILIPCKVPG